MLLSQRLALLALMAAWGGVAADEPSFGRLFFTPQQRALLDLQRKGNEPGPIEPRVDGLVIGSKGRTLWRDNQRLYTRLPRLTRLPADDTATRVTLDLGDRRTTVQVGGSPSQTSESIANRIVIHRP
jgi:hypothetical protein